MERPDDRNASRLLRYALYLLLTAAFLTGGSSQIAGLDDTFVQLLALPVLAAALWLLARQPASMLRNLALGAAALIALVPLVQLLPLPARIWQLPEARQLLARDIAVLGTVPDLHWSLDTSATRQALWFLLPPMAAFCATLTLGTDSHGRLLRLVMLLALSSLLLGFVQLGVPQESLLNPFPQLTARLNGIFANQNHQSISLVVAMVIALVGMFGSLSHVHEGRRQAWAPWALGFAAILALCALPLTGSRAAVLIAVFAVAAVPLSMGFFGGRRLREGRWARAGLVACLALIGLGVWGTVGWMQVDAVDELRAPLRAATFALGNEHVPLGTGVGAFVPAFEQAIPDALLLPNYVNHAHNEYLQWWMEAGWLGVLVMALALAVLVAASVAAFRSGRQGSLPAIASVLGLAALLLHSWVDYPLRTGSLATVAGLLAGVVVARAASPRCRSRSTPVGEFRDGRHTS